MNTSAISPSARESERLSCLESAHNHAGSLRVRADDERVYAFSTHHYLDALLEANPQPGEAHARERLVIRFSTGEVIVLGSGLERVEEALSEGRLRGLKTIEPRLASQLRHPPLIVSLSVHLNPQV
jgi:hypothetical protein